MTQSGEWSACDEGGVRGSVGGPWGNDLESECGLGKSGENDKKNEYAHIRNRLLTWHVVCGVLQATTV